MNNECARVVKHLNRIQGQIDALKRSVEDERPCADVAHLLRSITTSFGSVRATIAEEMLMRELSGKKVSPRDRDSVRSIVSVLEK